MRQSPHVRRRVSFTPIMLTSKSIRPVDRSHYQMMRNQQKINKITKNRNDLTQLIFKERVEVEKPSAFQENEGQDVEEQSYRKLVRKMTTPTVVKVQFQKQLIRCRKRAEMKIRQFQKGQMAQELRNEANRTMYMTNAKTFEQFTKMNKLKVAKKSVPYEESTDEQWKKYLNKYYLSIRKVKPLMKKDDGMRLLSPQKIAVIVNMQSGYEVQEEEEEMMGKWRRPSRTQSKRESRHLDKREITPEIDNRRAPQEECISQIVLKRIEQDISMHKVQNRKDFFVFGLSQSSKTTESAQLKIKLENYWDFIFRVNFTNGLYVCVRDEDRPLKFYVGFGNNSAIIKGVIRRRYWWQLTDKLEQANFVWTQLKLSQIFKCQGKNRLNSKNKQIRPNKQSRGLLNREEQMEEDKLMCGNDLRIWQRYYQNNMRHEEKGFTHSLIKRAGALLRYKKIDLIESSTKFKIHNHLSCNYFLGNKKALFYSMRKYYQLRGQDPFLKIPLTFHITLGLEDPEFQKFLTVFQDFNQKRKSDKDLRNIWIVKPGELTNRGRGITVCSTLDQIKVRLKSKQRNSNGTIRTLIIQKYIQKPLLYQKRKFDIRHYMAISCINGHMKGYWYADGYVRTTSTEYNVKNTKDLFTHLTNDAVQKNGQDYGKFQKGNKVSYGDFRKYLVNSVGPEADFYGMIMPKMKELATDTIRATYDRLDPERKEHNFELFGLDFMLDQNLDVFLIEVNTNPCLEQSCPLMTKILVPLVDNLFKICLDPLLPPPVQWPCQRKYFLGSNALQQNKFTLVFDEQQEGAQLVELYRNESKLDDRMGDISEQQEQYNDEQKQWNQEQEVSKK